MSKRKSVMMASDAQLDKFLNSSNLGLAKEASREYDRRQKNAKAVAQGSDKVVQNEIEKKVEKKSRRASKKTIEDSED
mgnify:CR=1 FL=1